MLVTSCKILSFFIVVGCIEKLVYSVVQLEGYLYIREKMKNVLCHPQQILILLVSQRFLILCCLNLCLNIVYNKCINMFIFSLFQCEYIQSPRRKDFFNNSLSFARNVLRLRSDTSETLRLHLLCFS